MYKNIKNASLLYRKLHGYLGWVGSGHIKWTHGQLFVRRGVVSLSSQHKRRQRAHVQRPAQREKYAQRSLDVGIRQQVFESSHNMVVG